MNLVIDDHILRDVLLEGEPAWLRQRRRRGRLITTGGWYFRLCSALVDPSSRGQLSGPVAQLPEDLREGVIRVVAQLPDHIELISLRELGWPAAALARKHGLNFLAAEALAAAIHGKAAIATDEPNVAPRLHAAADAERIKTVVRPH